MTDIPAADPFAAVRPGERHLAYAELAAAGPVRQIALPGGTRAWLVLHRDAARSALTDPRLVKTTNPPGLHGLRRAPQEYASIRNHLLLRDGSEHARMRRLVGAAFTARRVQALEPRMRAIANQLLDAMADREVVDLVPAYALPLPMTVICELVGVPEHLRGALRDSTAAMVLGLFADPGAYVGGLRAHAELARELVALKREEPADDLLSALVAARDGGDRLTEDELTSMVSLLVVAGHETTAHLIGNGVHLLLTNPDQLERVRARPDLLDGAVEEMLRADGPVQTTLPLLATAPLELASVPIAEGDLVYVALLAANRDAARVGPDPDRFDICRPYAPHLAFGHGIHHCLGAPLARLEARVALTELLARHPGLSLAVPPEQLRRHPNMLIHGLANLPVRLR